MPCVFRSTGWGVRRLTTEEILGAMDLPSGTILEAFSRTAEQSKALLTYFLKLTPIKYLQFSLAVGLGIGLTVSSSQNNNVLAPLPPVYTLRY